MKHTSRAGGLFVALGVCPVAAAQVVIHVPKEYPTIQEAIAVAADGDEVLVEPGTYPETIDFLGKAITVGSAMGADQTMIDGAGRGDSVVRFAAGEGPSARLRGFTITGGEGGPVDRLTRGGGVLVQTASPTIIDCRFVANRANFGGGAFVDKGSPAFVNCVFLSNEAGFGGGIFNNNSFPTLSNCTFRANEAGFGGGIYNVGGVPVVANSILWGNEPDEIVGSNSTVSFSNVRGGGFGAGSGNIDEDPLFVDDDGRLGPNSPCIDAGSNELVPAGVETDIDGRLRIIRALGTTPIVDMGAYEFDTCGVADLDGNGAIDFGDLLVVLRNWGPCPPSGGDKCPGDILENGVVDFGDFLVILITWGPCTAEGTCDVGFECEGEIVECGPGDPCVCFTLADGTFECLDSTGNCKELQQCPDGDCPPGFDCAVNTCCGFPICLPVCGADVPGLGDLQPGDLTPVGIWTGEPLVGTTTGAGNYIDP